MTKGSKRGSVLVTGANSLLGTNVIMELLGRGYHVRGFLRNKKKFLPEGTNIELFEGDITRRNELNAAFEGCEAVIHTAAVTEPGLPPRVYHEVNYEGTCNVANAAKKNGLKKLVFVSTANTIGYGSATDPGNEQMPPKKPFTRLPYVQSKLKAEETLLSAAASSPPETVIVNPTFMIGRWDSKPGSGRIITMIWGKRIFFVPPGGKNFIHAADAATGVCNALEKGENGQRYILSGVNMKYIDFFRLVKKIAGSGTILARVSYPLVILAGLPGSVISMTGRQTPVTVTTMKVLCTKNYYTADKARRELGLPCSPVETAVMDAADWFRKQGMLR